VGRIEGQLGSREEEARTGGLVWAGRGRG